MLFISRFTGAKKLWYFHQILNNIPLPLTFPLLILPQEFTFILMSYIGDIWEVFISYHLKAWMPQYLLCSTQILTWRNHHRSECVKSLYNPTGIQVLLFLSYSQSLSFNNIIRTVNIWLFGTTCEYDYMWTSDHTVYI